MKVKTVWEVKGYNLLGNKKDGYEVNDAFYLEHDYELTLDVKTYNTGTPQEFKSAYPTDRQIKEALDVNGRAKIDTEGDDLTIYVHATAAKYGGFMPLGELHCISHESLSPIREKRETK